MGKNVILHFRVSEQENAEIENLVKNGKYETLSDAIRTAIRKLLQESAKA